MKYLLSILICLFSLSASAKCGRCVRVWPKADTIAPCQWFYLELIQFDYSEQFDSRKIYLYNSKDTVYFNLIDERKGDFHAECFILEPKTELITGSRYRFMFDGLDDFSLHNLNESWIVSKNEVNNAPDWKKAPKIQKSEYVEYSCGPVESVSFELPFQVWEKSWQETNIIIQATLVNKKTGKQTTYYLPQDYWLTIGHSMCGGGFTFEKEAVYTLRLTAYNAASGLYARCPFEIPDFRPPSYYQKQPKKG